jgi:hypothetical protein
VQSERLGAGKHREGKRKQLKRISHLNAGGKKVWPIQLGLVSGADYFSQYLRVLK